MGGPACAARGLRPQPHRPRGPWALLPNRVTAEATQGVMTAVISTPSGTTGEGGEAGGVAGLTALARYTAGDGCGAGCGRYVCGGAGGGGAGGIGAAAGAGEAGRGRCDGLSVRLSDGVGGGLG
jgi:hypothetical protein